MHSSVLRTLEFAGERASSAASRLAARGPGLIVTDSDSRRRRVPESERESEAPRRRRRTSACELETSGGAHACHSAAALRGLQLNAHAPVAGGAVLVNVQTCLVRAEPHSGWPLSDRQPHGPPSRSFRSQGPCTDPAIANTKLAGGQLAGLGAVVNGGR
jgi:hypothetical protein